MLKNSTAAESAYRLIVTAIFKAVTRMFKDNCDVGTYRVKQSVRLLLKMKKSPMMTRHPRSSEDCKKESAFMMRMYSTFICFSCTIFPDCFLCYFFLNNLTLTSS